MTYTKQNWQNLPSVATALSAERLNHLETQYDEAVEYTNSKSTESESELLSGVNWQDQKSLGHEYLTPLVYFTARPAGTTLWPQGLAWDPDLRRWYVSSVGLVGGVSTLRITRYQEDGAPIDFKEVPSDSSSEGLPFWKNSLGQLCFAIRVSIGNEYRVLNYDTLALGPLTPITGRYKMDQRGGIVWTCDNSATTAGVRVFYGWDFESIKNSAPVEVKRVTLDYRCMYDKLQSFAIGPDGQFALNMGKANKPFGSIVFNKYGRKLYGAEYDNPSFGRMLNTLMSGWIADVNNYRHEGEGAAFHDGKLVTGHVVDNNSPSNARFVLVKHGDRDTGTPVSATEIVRDHSHEEFELEVPANPYFEVYNTGTPVIVSREGDSVTLRGQLRTLSSGWMGQTAFSLPTGYRPFAGAGNSNVYKVMPTSGSASYTIQIFASGAVQLARSQGADAAGQWLPFYVRFKGE